MITISGKSVFGGVSIGKILFYQRNDKVYSAVYRSARSCSIREMTK